MEDFNSFSHGIKFSYEFDKEKLEILEILVLDLKGTVMKIIY